MKKIHFFSLILILVVSPVLFGGPPRVGAADAASFKPGRIIDDSIFNDKTTMGVSDIQTFLNNKRPTCDTNGEQMIYDPAHGDTVPRSTYGSRRGNPPPYICLKDYSQNSKSAAQIIWDKAQEFSINPKVLIVTLQKEQGLVTDDWPWQVQYNSAMGFACPDGGPCDPNYSGFTLQMHEGARHFRNFWDLNPNWTIPHRPGTNTIKWHPNSGCGTSEVFIENRATAALYSYTPYRPNQAALTNLYSTGDSCSSYGNRNFWRDYSDWFGDPFSYACWNGNNITGAGPGPRVVTNEYSAGANAIFTLTVLNQTGSKCVEMHTWNSSLQGWLTNIASNLGAVNPPDGEIISGNTYGDGKSEMMLISSRVSGSGRLEIHTWDASLQHWLTNIATNHPVTDPADSDVVAMDANGDGHDELVFVKYRNTGSGRIEVHEWSQDRQRWTANTATNLPEIDPADGRIIAANLYGSSADELIFVKYRNTGSGRIEIHTWAGSAQGWLSNVATNHPEVNPDEDSFITSGNIYGGAVDELVFVKYRNTGSGKIEIHTWAAGQQAWLSNVATNHPQF